MSYAPRKTPSPRIPKSLRDPTAQKYDASGSYNAEALPRPKKPKLKKYSSQYPYDTNWRVTERREDDI
jgi:hypothetical protein